MPRLSAHWRKVQRDLARDRLRTTLAVVSIAVGVSAVGMVTGASATLSTTLDGAYHQNEAASARFVLAGAPPAAVAEAAEVPGVTRAEGRHSMTVRLHAGAQWRNLTLTAVPDYAHFAIDRFYPQDGAWPPPTDQLLLERSSLALLGIRSGSVAEIELADGRRVAMPVAGTVHDLNYPSARAAGILNGYVAFRTLPMLGEPDDVNRLSILVDPSLRTREQVGAVVAVVRARLNGAGYAVLADAVPTPGQFWADDQINATVLLLDVMAVVSFLMSAFLVVNIVSALVARQVRDIGVMKSVGASPRVVAAVYLSAVATYAVLAFLVAVPVGAAGAVGIVASTQDVLNFDPPGPRLFSHVVLIQAVSALVVAVGAAIPPVLGATRITVREAIAAGGVGAGGATRGLARALPGGSTLLRLATANALRRRSRAALTLVALVLAGAAFVAVLSVRASVDRTLADAVATRGYDVQLTLARPLAEATATDLARRAAGVGTLEPWTLTGAIRLRDDGTESETIQVIAPPADTALVRPHLLSGRWLSAGRHEIVVDSDLLEAEPDLTAGRMVALDIAGQRSVWHVVGVARGALGGPTAYADRADIDALLGSAGSVTSLAATATGHDPATEAALARALEDAFKSNGAPVAAVDTTAQWHDFLAADYGIATNFLLGMAVMLAAVGGLSLVGMLSINVLERTREIGILRAIGASDGAVQRLVLGEGLALGALAWVAAVPFAPVASRLLSDAFGLAFLHFPLTFVFAWTGLAIWALLVAVLAAVSSVMPAWNASRLTIREVLANE